MLPVEWPIAVTEPIPTPKSIHYKEVTAEETLSTAAESEREEQYPVATEQVECIRRRYKMAYIPSGFWSRLISRLLINLKRSGMVDMTEDSGIKMVYWRRGLMVSYDTRGFLVHSLTPPNAGVRACVCAGVIVCSCECV